MINKCCPPPVYPIIEIDIPDEQDTNLISIQGLKLPNPKTDICELKDSIICDYFKIITELELGKHPNIEILLEKISVIELEEELDNREYIVQYYLNI